LKRQKHENIVSGRMINRRSLLIGGAQFATAAALAFRMRQLQVEEADQFRLLADENRINIRLLPPARGEIFDRNGIVLAENEPSYRITLTREDAGDVELVLSRLAQLIEVRPEDIERAKAELARSVPFLPVTIMERLSWEDFSKVALNSPALPGITPEVGLSRYYPLADNFCHSVGYVGPVSPRDIERRNDNDPLLRIPRFQIGKVGVEAKLERELRGRAGTKRVEVNAIGRVMRELGRQEGVSGATVQLSIDAKLQAYARARLGEESASVVVLDCETGDVLAAASAPSYDPNKFVRGISYADYDALNKNDHRPLASKTVQDAYPPGSTFKMVTALAALEAGVVNTSETVYCPGHYEVGGRKFHCWRRSGHGAVGLEAALRESCDVYFYDLSMRVGIEKISEMASKLGLGEAPDIPMSAVTSGIAPTKDWKLSKFGKDWVLGDTVNASIGQGYVLSSPLQLALMTARLATGRSVSPRLVKSIDGIETPKLGGEKLDIDPRFLRAVQKGMYAVSNNRRGTAYKSRIIADENRMAGKTGTSQVRNITEAERRRGVIRNEDLPWNRRDHALYVNFAPFDNPKIAVCVVVEHGGGGSKAAAPIARDITLQALYGDMPPLSAYPQKDRGRIKREQAKIAALMPEIKLGRRGRG
jgi:penicillin-binding protein 2